MAALGTAVGLEMVAYRPRWQSLHQQSPLSSLQTCQVRTPGHAGQAEKAVRDRDGDHQPGGEGAGQEDGELPEERGARWEDQQT